MTKISKINIEKKICELWDGFNCDTVRRVLNKRKPMISVAMLSLYRIDKLLSMMNHWGQHIYIKSNLSLNVQGSEKISKRQKQLIEEYSNKNFNKSKIFYNEGNFGTGIPRHDMVHKALDFNTPYIMTTDDDMYFPPGSIEAQISILEDNPEIGAVDIWCYPNLNAWEIGNKNMIYRKPKSPFGYVDAMGSATMVMRREVFETSDLDPGYFIGWGDIDFCMQMRKAGWKLAILAIKDYYAINSNNDNTIEYESIRHNKQHAINSGKRFFKKWGKRI